MCRAQTTRISRCGDVGSPTNEDNVYEKFAKGTIVQTPRGRGTDLTVRKCSLCI
jgi:hypothetical protein